MTSPVPDPVADWLARLAAAQPAEVFQRLAALEAQQTTSVVAVAALAQKIYNLEENLMATAEEFATRLNAATDDVAADLKGLRDELAAVRDEIPAAQRAAVDAALGKLDAPIARLEGLGQDPANPVPDPEPTPAPPVDDAPPAA